MPDLTDIRTFLATTTADTVAIATEDLRLILAAADPVLPVRVPALTLDPAGAAA